MRKAELGERATTYNKRPGTRSVSEKPTLFNFLLIGKTELGAKERAEDRDGQREGRARKVELEVDMLDEGKR